MVIDDQGKSAVGSAATHERDGFARLVAAVGLGEVGIIFALEVSRLADNSAEWYRLLELAALAGVLIADDGAVYDPRLFNDRLLLGLRGTVSEVELLHDHHPAYLSWEQCQVNTDRLRDNAVRFPRSRGAVAGAGRLRELRWPDAAPLRRHQCRLHLQPPPSVVRRADLSEPDHGARGPRGQ
jgi:Resolvase, N terminal domain